MVKGKKRSSRQRCVWRETKTNRVYLYLFRYLGPTLWGDFFFFLIFVSFFPRHFVLFFFFFFILGLSYVSLIFLFSLFSLFFFFFFFFSLFFFLSLFFFFFVLHIFARPRISLTSSSVFTVGSSIGRREFPYRYTGGFRGAERKKDVLGYLV